MEDSLIYVFILWIVLDCKFLGMFVVSSGHTDPLGVFNTLSQQQSQQHNQFPNKLPKWFCPNILKYYVLLHDVVEGEQAKWVYTSLSLSPIPLSPISPLFLPYPSLPLFLPHPSLPFFSPPISPFPPLSPHPPVSLKKHLFFLFSIL